MCRVTISHDDTRVTLQLPGRKVWCLSEMFAINEAVLALKLKLD